MPPSLRRPKLCLCYGPEDRELIEEFTLVLAGTVAIDLGDVFSAPVLVAGGKDVGEGTAEMVSSALSADVLLAFVSETTLRAPSVLLELGARRDRARSGQSSPEQRTILVMLQGMSPVRLPHPLRQADTRVAHEPSDLRQLLGELTDMFGERAEGRGRLLPAERERRINRILELARPRGGPPPSAGSRARRRSRRVAVAVGAAVALGGIGAWAVLGRSAAGPEPKYDFEQNAQGWGTRGGCVQASLSTEEARRAQSALKLVMALDGSDPKRQSCEAFVDLAQGLPHGGGAVPANLSGRTVTAWVYAPRGAAGNRQKPNGFQLFVKDSGWRAAYGAWHNVSENRWTRIELDLGAAPPPGAFVAAGFDPTRIAEVGLKMALGGDPSAAFEGAIYLDALDW